MKQRHEKYRAITAKNEEIREHQVAALIELRMQLLDIAALLESGEDPRIVGAAVFHCLDHGFRPYVACHRQGDPIAALGADIQLASRPRFIADDYGKCRCELADQEALSEAVRKALRLLNRAF